MISIGLQLAQWGRAANRADLLRTARAAETAGFDSLWVSDHIVFPVEGEANYPSPRGKPPFQPEDGYLEALTTLAVVAGATNTIRLGTSVLLPAMRDTLLTAKTIATLDVLSGGRISVAVGAGWWRAEFEALGMDFETRGARLDELLLAWQNLWTYGRHSMSGKYVSYPLVTLEPRPLQPRGPEIWIGGFGSHVWRRVVRSGAVGWHGIGHSADRFEAARNGLADACQESGRDPKSVRLSTSTGMPSEPARAAGRIIELARMGLSQVVLISHETSVASALEVIESFGTVTKPQVARELGESTQRN